MAASHAKARTGSRSKLPTVSIIGAGRLGSALLIALDKAGFKVEAVVCRTRAHAKRAAALISSSVTALTAANIDQLPDSDLLILSTPDDLIASVAAELAVRLPQTKKKRVAVHTSGALSSSVLFPLKENGFAVGSIHPLVSVSKPESGVQQFAGAWFCVEGDRPAVAKARKLATALGGNAFTIEPENKALYHAAAVMTSGSVTSLIDIAIEILKQCGLDARQASTVLQPLLESTVHNLRNRKPAGALTGPIARGDVATIKSHLRALRTAAIDDAVEAYVLLAKHAIKMRRREGLEDDAAVGLLRLLQK